MALATAFTLAMPAVMVTVVFAAASTVVIPTMVIAPARTLVRVATAWGGSCTKYTGWLQAL